jgi:uncharacterized protein YjbJ (UPF0337 family)
MNNGTFKTPDAIKDDWMGIKSKIKTRFAKLSDESIDSVKGNLDLLSGKIQSAYGYAREQADKEIQSFRASLHEATEPTKQK